MEKPQNLVLRVGIEEFIFVLRGEKLMLDSDLARIYGVTTKRLNEQVRRNIHRFPEDFMFQLSQEEWDSLRSQIATLKNSRGRHRKYLPYAFTEHGAIMLASTLNSKIAVEASVRVVRAFIKMREILGQHQELTRKLSQVERRLSGHDEDLKMLVSAIRELMTPPKTKRKKIGF